MKAGRNRGCVLTAYGTTHRGNQESDEATPNNTAAAARTALTAVALQRAIVNSTRFSSIATDAQGVIQIFNAGAERMLGYAAADVVNNISAAELHDPQEVVARAAALSLEFGVPVAPGFEALVCKARRGIEDIYEVTKIRKDGTRFPAIVSVTALRDPQDELIGYLLIGTDNTARHEAAEERRIREEEGRRFEQTLQQIQAQRKSDAGHASELALVNQELETFSYSVSHDLRAPLRHIHGYVEMLKNATAGQLAGKPLHYLNTIAAASVEMGQLIDDLLSFSRIGRAEIRAARIDLNVLVADVIRVLDIATAGRQVTWDVADLPMVQGDPTLLKQVFTNLLDNALKYTRTRTPARVSVRAVGDEGGRVVVAVQDNGVGFDMRYVGKLFGVFQRLHRAEDFEGTGIGLATTQRIITRHGGRIWAESAVGAGATFFVTLERT